MVYGNQCFMGANVIGLQNLDCLFPSLQQIMCIIFNEILLECTYPLFFWMSVSLVFLQKIRYHTLFLITI